MEGISQSNSSNKFQVEKSELWNCYLDMEVLIWPNDAANNRYEFNDAMPPNTIFLPWTFFENWFCLPLGIQL